MKRTKEQEVEIETRRSQKRERALLRFKAISESKTKRKLQKEQRDRELNEMWKGIASYFACDGTCPICVELSARLSSINQRVQHQREDRS
jgi:hypothetical protein